MVYILEYGRFTEMSSQDRGNARRAQLFRWNTDRCSSAGEASGHTLALRRVIIGSMRWFGNSLCYLLEISASKLERRILSQKRQIMKLYSPLSRTFSGKRSIYLSLWPDPCTFERSLWGLLHWFGARPNVSPTESAAHATTTTMEIPTTGTTVLVPSIHASGSSSCSSRGDEEIFND